MLDGTFVASASVMVSRKLLRHFGFAGGALTLGLFVACAAPSDPANSSGSAATDVETFDANKLLTDKALRDATALTADDVQSFLEKTPSGTKSALADLKEDGRTAATILVEAAVANDINPLELLVRAQMHQGLIARKSGSKSEFDTALGCGCSDGDKCSDAYKGFAKQANCAAGVLNRAMKAAAAPPGTVTGWQVGKSKATEDGVTIKPENAATAALYTYTPYVGEGGGGKVADAGGAYLHFEVWTNYATFLKYEAKARAATDGGTRSEPDAEPAADAAADATADDAAPNGDPDRDADPGPKTDPKADGPPEDGPKTDPKADGPPEDGSEDSDIIGEGTSPPEDNAPREAKTGAKPSDLTRATDAEVASKPKSGGCSTTSQGGDSSSILAGGAALALMFSRRRRSSR